MVDHGGEEPRGRVEDRPAASVVERLQQSVARRGEGRHRQRRGGWVHRRFDADVRVDALATQTSRLCNLMPGARPTVAIAMPPREFRMLRQRSGYEVPVWFCVSEDCQGPGTYSTS